MTTKDRAIALTKRNLQAIFSEKNATTRLKSIADLWVADGEVFFVDPHAIYKTHPAMSDMVDDLQAKGHPEEKFIELSEVECLKHDEESDTWVTRVAWGVGTSKETLKVTGVDVVTVIRGKIKSCYTFLDAK